MTPVRLSSATVPRRPEIDSVVLRKTFVTPVAKIIQQVTTTRAAAQPTVTLPDDDLLLAVVIKVAKGGPPGVKLRDVTNSFSITDTQVKKIVSSTPVLSLDAQDVTSSLKEKFLICYKYNVGTCKEPHSCDRLHLCAKWLFGKCTERVCNFEHRIVTDMRSQEKLANLGLSNWKEDRLKLLIIGLENQIGMVCKHYNNNGCRSGENCDYFHICAKFVDRKCFGRNCNLCHKLHHCENIKNVKEKNNVRWLDEFEQHRARLGLKLSIIPKFASYDALVTEKMSRNASQVNPGGRNRNLPQSALVHHDNSFFNLWIDL